MTAEVHVVLGEAHNVLTVPVAALGESAADGTARVRVVEASGSVVTRTVKVGLSNKILTEVRGGVAAGERVVIGTSGGDATQGKSSVPPPPGM